MTTPLVRFSFLVSFTALGCSSFDDDVFPHVVAASISVDPTKPSELAAIGVTVRIEAGRTADRAVALRAVSLHPIDGFDGAGSSNLDMAFPSRGEIRLEPGEEATVTLVNRGTTNADLAPLCRQRRYLSVSLAYPDDPDSWTGSGSDTPLITVLCE